MKSNQPCTFALILVLGLVGATSLPAVAEEGTPVTNASTPVEMRDQADVVAKGAREEALGEARARAGARRDEANELKRSTSAELRAATAAFASNKSLDNMRRLALAQAAANQAPHVGLALTIAADKQLALEEAAIETVYLATMRHHNLRVAYVAYDYEGPCLDAFLVEVERLGSRQAEAARRVASDSALDWDSAVEDLRTGLAAPNADVVEAQVQREAARVAYQQAPDAATRDKYRFWKGEYAYKVRVRNAATKDLRAAFSEARMRLPEEAKTALRDTEKTYDSDLKPYNETFLTCLGVPIPTAQKA